MLKDIQELYAEFPIRKFRLVFDRPTSYREAFSTPHPMLPALGHVECVGGRAWFLEGRQCKEEPDNVFVIDCNFKQVESGEIAADSRNAESPQFLQIRHRGGNAFHAVSNILAFYFLENDVVAVLLGSASGETVTYTGVDADCMGRLKWQLELLAAKHARVEWGTAINDQRAWAAR